jgi:hypothetical protein
MNLSAISWKKQLTPLRSDRISEVYRKTPLDLPVITDRGLQQRQKIINSKRKKKFKKVDFTMVQTALDFRGKHKAEGFKT